MPSTRSGRNNTSSPAQPVSPENKKRKADTSSPAGQASKRGKPAKEQKTIEETLDIDTSANKQPTEQPTDGTKPADQKPATNGHKHENGHYKKQTDEQTKDLKDVSQTNGNSNETKTDDANDSNGPSKQEDKQDVEMTDGDTAEVDNVETSEAAPEQSQVNKTAETAPEQSQVNKTAETAPEKTQNDKTSDTAEQAQNGTTAAGEQATTEDAVQNDAQREQAMPSNILEKGIIYFFTRGRVGTDDPESVQDLQRSFFVLRPLALGDRLTEGSVQDSNNSRLFALPKKVWPKSGKDRFMVFVEKAKASMALLKEEFFQGSEYSTQTMGVRHTPPVSPIGEGVYAITTTGGGQGTTHLAYMLTVPSELGQVQSDVGLAEKGSFILSLKNPEASGPSYAQLPEKPDYPKEFIDEFRGRGWMPVHPKHLDYPNAQLLIIGEDFESSNNLEPKPKDEQDEKKETPEEELQKLEDEDEHRVEALKGDDTIFADLGISKKDYGILTTCKRIDKGRHLHEEDAHDNTTRSSIPERLDIGYRNGRGSSSDGTTSRAKLPVRREAQYPSFTPRLR